MVDQLLQLGYNVGGTVRGEKPWLELYFKKKYGTDQFETMILPVFKKDALGLVLRGVSGIIHLLLYALLQVEINNFQKQASDVSFNPDPYVVIPSAIENVVILLETAARQSSIRRVGLTSSTTAAFTIQPGKKGVVVNNGMLAVLSRRDYMCVRTDTYATLQSWNNESVRARAAWDPDTPSKLKPVLVYSASKTEAERKAWELVRLNKPLCGFNSVLPSMNVSTLVDRHHVGFCALLYLPLPSQFSPWRLTKIPWV